MRCSLGILVASFLAALAGCGSGSVPPAATPTYLNLNGNWEAIGLSAQSTQGLLTTPIAAFTGALQSSNGSVSGTLRGLDLSFINPCVALTQDLRASGTLSASGNLVLSVPISGGTATLTAGLSSDLQNFVTGSWTIVGGSCAMAATPMAMVQYARVTGTYSGTLTSFGTTNNPTTVTAVLTQSATPNADGQFPLTGTVTYTGSCAGSYTLTPEYVTGNGIFYSEGNLQISAASLEGVIQPTATSIQAANTTIFSLSCAAGSLSGTLTRQ